MSDSQIMSPGDRILWTYVTKYALFNKACRSKMPQWQF